MTPRHALLASRLPSDGTRCSSRSAPNANVGGDETTTARQASMSPAYTGAQEATALTSSVWSTVLPPESVQLPILSAWTPTPTLTPTHTYCTCSTTGGTTWPKARQNTSTTPTVAFWTGTALPNALTRRVLTTFLPTRRVAPSSRTSVTCATYQRNHTWGSRPPWTLGV